MGGRRRNGFTLLEVLVAMAILGIAVTAMMQLSSQSLRLLHLSGEHQRAILLADRLVRQTPTDVEGAQSGEEDGYAWERRITAVVVPKELTAPGAAAAPQLRSISVAVRWGRGRAVQLATMRASLADSALPRTP